MKVLFRTIPGYINATNPEDVWIVEKIVNHEKKNDGYWYEVKWKGFDKEDNTWEPEKNINDQNIIDKYWRLKSGIKIARTARGKANSATVALFLMTMRRDTLFNEADQTAQTTNKQFKQKLLLRCAEMEKNV